MSSATNVGIYVQPKTGDVSVTGNIYPSACNVYDLGSAERRWKDLYLSGNTIDLGGTKISRDANGGGITIASETGGTVDSRVKNLFADGTITASNLNIVGDYVTMRTTTSNTEMMVIENAGTGPALKVTQTGVNSIAEFYDDGGVLALKIADGGNVGIGTSGPLQKLHVVGAIKATTSINSDTQFLGQGSDSAAAPSFSFIDDTNTGIFRPVADNVGITCGGTERVRVLSNGNVGIGTTNPLATLTAFGSGQASLATFNTSTLGGTLHVCDSTSQVYNGGAVVFGTYQGNFAAIKSSIIDGTPNTVGHLSFYTRNTNTDSTLTNRMTILNNGNVGIGTTQPLATLHVNGPVSMSGALLNNNVVMSALLYSGSFTVASSTYTSIISLPTTGYSMFEVKFWGASTSDTLGGLFIDANFTNSTHGGWRSVTDVPRYERSTLFTSLSGDLLNQTYASKESGHYIGNLTLDFHGKITFPSTTLWQSGGGGLYRHHTGSLSSGNTAGRGASTYTSTSMAGYNSQATINAIRFYHAATGITIHYRVFAY